MINYDDLYSHGSYSLSKNDKKKFFYKNFKLLNDHHTKNCIQFRNFNKLFKFNEFIPIPIRVFKNHDLISVDNSKIIQVMNSSGTSGKLSKIYLDKITSRNQIKALTSISSNFIGKKRMPMIVIDNDKVIKSERLAARAAGVLGFKIMSSDICFALKDNMEINFEIIQKFISKYKSNFLVFGFTFILWKYFLKQLNKKNINLNLEKSYLIHGGGWKKMESESITNEKLKKIIKKTTSITNVHNYYGMIEQTGSIFFECSQGYLHTSIFSEIIIRNSDFSVCKLNQEGIIQLQSLLPYSYPGHNILTEDKGVLLGEDNCKCGLKGKYFKITRRLQDAELRGCSDVYD